MGGNGALVARLLEFELEGGGQWVWMSVPHCTPLSKRGRICESVYLGREGRGPFSWRVGRLLVLRCATDSCSGTFVPKELR